MSKHSNNTCVMNHHRVFKLFKKEMLTNTENKLLFQFVLCNAVEMLKDF